jgi:hypothetical protein
MHNTIKIFLISIGLIASSLFGIAIHKTEAATSGGSVAGIAWSGNATATQWAGDWIFGAGLVGKFKNECGDDMIDNAGNNCFNYITSWAGNHWFGASKPDTRWCKYTTTVRTWGACSASGIQYATSYNYNTVYGTTSCIDQAPTFQRCTPPTYACIGTIPSGSSAWDTEESQGLTANASWSFSATDTATKCQYHATPTYACIGTIPSGSSAWDTEESQGLVVNRPWSFSATDTATKCQYRNCTCGDSVGTCIGSYYNNSCGVGVCSGTKDCRDLNWREVAPN